MGSRMFFKNLNLIELFIIFTAIEIFFLAKRKASSFSAVIRQIFEFPVAFFVSRETQVPSFIVKTGCKDIPAIADQFLCGSEVQTYY
jgi:hypothetical protein